MSEPGPLPAVSIIVPVLNEAAGIVATLDALQDWRGHGAELIVVDGGSADSTCALAAPRCDRLIHAPRGRAAQMNAGALAARAEVHQTYLSGVERGRRNPSALILQRIATALGADIEDLTKRRRQ